MALNAALLRSISLPSLFAGPRSVISTITVLRLATFITVTFVPSGKFHAAAVMADGLNGFPLAIGLSAHSYPYQDASPAIARMDFMRKNPTAS